MYNKGIVFGVFDGLHEGHRHFLTSAASRCEELVVAVAPDEIVEALKGKLPRQPLRARIDVLTAWNGDLKVVAGDSELNSWAVLRREKPDIVFLGYDQKTLEDGLRAAGVPCISLGAHEPERHKSSLINGSTPGISA